MSLLVTLHVFSGRPNPVWVLPDAAEEEFRQRLARTSVSAVQSNVKPVTAIPALGYAGFTVESDASRIRVGPGLIDPGPASATLLPVDRELERFLFLTGQQFIPESARGYVERQLSAGITLGPIVLQPPTLRCPICLAQDAPLLDLGLWSGAAAGGNNCYNYANNRMTNTTAQPGKASGNLFTDNTSPTGPGSVYQGALSDGLTPVSNFGGTLPAGQGWYVALVLWPGSDFHWYRQDSAGCWSHKRGGEDPTRFDSSMQQIRDPKSADRGPYTTFVSYMVTRCCTNIR